MSINAWLAFVDEFRTDRVRVLVLYFVVAGGIQRAECISMHFLHWSPCSSPKFGCVTCTRPIIRPSGSVCWRPWSWIRTSAVWVERSWKDLSFIAGSKLFKSHELSSWTSMARDLVARLLKWLNDNDHNPVPSAWLDIWSTSHIIGRLSNPCLNSEFSTKYLSLAVSSRMKNHLHWKSLPAYHKERRCLPKQIWNLWPALKFGQQVVLNTLSLNKSNMGLSLPGTWVRDGGLGRRHEIELGYVRKVQAPAKLGGLSEWSGLSSLNGFLYIPCLIVIHVNMVNSDMLLQL